MPDISIELGEGKEYAETTDKSQQETKEQRKQREYQQAQETAQLRYEAAQVKAGRRFQKAQTKQYGRELRDRTFELEHPRLFKLSQFLSSVEKKAVEVAKKKGKTIYQRSLSRHSRKARKRAYTRFRYAGNPKKAITMKPKKRKRSSDPLSISSYI